jgi:cytochrome c
MFNQYSQTEFSQVNVTARPLARPASSGSLAVNLALATLVFTAVVLPVDAAASRALAQKYACVACHQPASKLLGPSWKDIGVAYGEGKGTAAQLITSIKEGSSGRWGAMPMPPHTQVPDTDWA